MDNIQDQELIFRQFQEACSDFQVKEDKQSQYQQALKIISGTCDSSSSRSDSITVPSIAQCPVFVSVHFGAQQSRNDAISGSLGYY
jgi:hypothetical protein